MSKDLVVQKQVKKDKNVIVLVKPADTVIPAGELFASAVDAEWFDQTVKYSEDEAVEKGSLVGMLTGLGGLIASTFVGMVGQLSEEAQLTFLAYVLGVSILSGAGATVGFVRRRRNNLKLVTQVVPIAEKMLADWLQARYDVQIQEKQLNEVARYVSLNHPYVSFVDVTGKSFYLKKNEAGKYYMAAAPVYKEVGDYVAEIVVSKLSDELLTGEASILGDSIIARLAKLKNFDLSTEANHVVSRVEHDLKQVLQLNEKMHHLGSESSEEIVDILSELNQELNILVQTQMDEVKNELAVQKIYIKSRQQVSSKSPLMIVPNMVVDVTAGKEPVSD